MALEQKIFDATLSLLETEGYAAITFSKVADAARTGRSVLYRRWPTTFDLLSDALRNRLAQGGRIKDMDFDQGGLRDDLIALLEFLISNVVTTDVEIMRNLLYHYGFSNSISEVQDSATQADLVVMDKIISRAVARGEMTQIPSTPVKLLPFELIRSRLIMGNQIPETHFVITFVDEVLLPVFQAR